MPVIGGSAIAQWLAGRAKDAASLLLALGLLIAAPAWAQTSASSFTKAARYDAERQLVGTIAPDPDDTGALKFAAVRNTYNAAGWVTKVETGELASWQAESVLPASWTGFTIFRTVDFTYDAMGRKLTEKVSSGGTAYALTQYSYDSYGRLECTAVRMNPAAYGALPGSACTLGTVGSYGPDRITRSSYDNGGQVLKVQQAYGVTTANGFPQTLQADYATYTYSPNGKVISMTDANGNKASMTYDGFDRQTKWNFPSKTTAGAVSTTDYEEYAYDANGNRTSLRKRDGNTIGYSYDALNRMTVKDIPGGTSADVYYGYDLRGLQLYARFGSTSGTGITNAYDGFGRLASTTNDMGTSARTLSYQYDANGNWTRITHADGVYFTYEYDGLNRAVAIRENGTTVIVTDVYDAQGRRASETRDTVTTTYSYDAVSRLATLSHDLSGTSYDVTSSFAYNPASQVVTRTQSNDSYAYRGNVNLGRVYTVNGLNQYSTAGPATFSYDANGNLTGDGTNTYTYDVENRMLTGSGPTATTLQYDPLGRLWRIVLSGGTIELTYDGDAIVYYTSGATGVNRYVHGNGQDDPLIRYASAGLDSRSSLQADAQGSIVSLVRADGTPQFINSYDEYGIPGSGNGGFFQYTGQVYLSYLGMYYYKARMYSPTLGRFMQTDPIGYEDQNNLYAYVGSDPLNRRDPFGLQQQAGALAVCEAQPELCILAMLGTGGIGAAMWSAQIHNQLTTNGHINSASTIPAPQRHPKAITSTTTRSVARNDTRRTDKYVVVVQLQGTAVGGNHSIAFAQDTPVSRSQVNIAVLGFYAALPSRQKQIAYPAVVGSQVGVNRAVDRGGAYAGENIQGRNSDYSGKEVRVDIEVIKGRNLTF